MNCLACHVEMKYLKEYKFYSQDNNRGFFATVFGYEERLIFDVYVCPRCKRSEFIYKGSSDKLDFD